MKRVCDNCKCSENGVFPVELNDGVVLGWFCRGHAVILGRWFSSGDFRVFGESGTRIRKY